MPLYLPRKIAAQPQGRVRVDFSNPLADRMTFAWTASNGFFESVAGDARNYAVNGNLVVNGVRSSRGVVQNTSVNGSVIWGMRGRTVNNISNQFTTGCAFQVRDLSADNPDVFSVTNFGTAFNKIGLSASKVQASTTAANTTVSSDNTVAVGDWVYVVYVLQNNNFQLYINGIKQSSTGSGSLITAAQNYNYVEINASRVNLLTAFVSTRTWSQAEVTSWNNNPWQIFMPTGVVFLPTGTAPPVTTANTFQSFSRGVGRGIARGIA